MSLGIVAAIVGTVAGGLAIGTTVNSLVSGGSNMSADVPAGGGSGPTIGSLLTSQINESAQTNDELEQVLTAQQNETAAVTGGVTDAEYAAIGLAGVALFCALFLHKKKHG